MVTVQASFCQALTYFFGNCVNGLAYWWGGKQIIAGNVTTTEFLIVTFSLLVSALLWSQMFALAPELSSARAAMARILSLIEIGSDKMQGHVPPRTAILTNSSTPSSSSIEEKGLEASGYLSPSTQGSSVHFRNVHFSYPARPDAPVLKGLSLDIQPGTFCALVGPSGAAAVLALVRRRRAA